MINLKFRLAPYYIMAISFVAACAPQPAVPTVDSVGTIAAQMASVMLTQTAGAATPTPQNTETPLPPLETATPEITNTPEYVATNRPEVIGFSPCYTGPGPNYPLTSNISNTKKVELIGIGSVPGWYVIKNPYFNSPCWISAEFLKIYSDNDLSQFPVISP